MADEKKRIFQFRLLNLSAEFIGQRMDRILRLQRFRNAFPETDSEFFRQCGRASDSAGAAVDHGNRTGRIAMEADHRTAS